jgi:RNA 2',3'-cyclic 3'-phosphodiesterase
MHKRIFVAVDISDDARRRVSAYAETLRRDFPNLRVGWEKAEKLHLTLKFLGETNENQLNDLIGVIEKTARQISDFKLQISDTGVFPSLRNPRILWLGLKDSSGSLSRINEILESECENVGFTREKRNYKAHLTIARLREPRDSKQIAQKHLENKFEPVEFNVSEFVVYESKLQPIGSIYTAILRQRLGKWDRGEINMTD